MGKDMEKRQNWHIMYYFAYLSLQCSFLVASKAWSGSHDPLRPVALKYIKYFQIFSKFFTLVCLQLLNVKFGHCSEVVVESIEYTVLISYKSNPILLINIINNYLPKIVPHQK